MATLSETAYYTRKGINFGIVAIVALVIFKFVFGIAVTAWKNRFPDPPPPPKACFGKIPALVFPTSLNNKQYTYTLETIDGSLPKLETIKEVFLVAKQTARLGSFASMKERALRLGFNSEPVRLEKSRWRFIDPTNTFRTLEIDEITENFLLKYNLFSDQRILLEKDLPNKEKAIALAKDLLSSQDILTEDLKNGEGKVTFLKVEVDTLVPVGSLSEADLVRVDLYRAKVKDAIFVGPKKGEALISFIISGSRDTNKKFLEVNYNYSYLSNQTICAGRYTLKTTAAAFEELKNNKAYISYNKLSEGEGVIIRRVSLAYYDSPEVGEYIQPVFVFEGDNFEAYVSAVDPKYISED